MVFGEWHRLNSAATQRGSWRCRTCPCSNLVCLATLRLARHLGPKRCWTELNAKESELVFCHSNETMPTVHGSTVSVCLSEDWCDADCMFRENLPSIPCYAAFASVLRPSKLEPAQFKAVIEAEYIGCGAPSKSHGTGLSLEAAWAQAAVFPGQQVGRNLPGARRTGRVTKLWSDRRTPELRSTTRSFSIRWSAARASAEALRWRPAQRRKELLRCLPRHLGPTERRAPRCNSVFDRLASGIRGSDLGRGRLKVSETPPCGP